MKALLLVAISLTGLPLLAQTPTPTPPAPPAAPTAPPAAQPPAGGEAMMSQLMSSLTPAEQTQLKAAQQKAILDNPNLQTEAMDLMQKNMALQSGTASDADRQAFRTQALAYAAKVRAAMVKADPTIEPVLRKVEAEEAKLRAEYAPSH
jgi:hypothetical protein